METDDKALVKQALRDPEGFAKIFDKYYSTIFSYTLKRTAHLQATQDITSEVFFKAYKKLWQFKFIGKPFSAWLYKIATNEINTYFKKGKVSPLPIAFMEELENLAITHNTPELQFITEQEEFAKHHDLAALYETIHKLPTKYQEVLALKYFEQKTIAEISQILNKKQGTVKSLISRGITKLELLMQPKSTRTVIHTESINSQSHGQTRN